MPRAKRVLRSAAALQRAIEQAGGEAKIVTAEITYEKQGQTEAQKQMREAEAKKLESKFAAHWRIRCPEIELTPQYKFHPARKWLFDFAIPTIRLAVEVDGGTWRDERQAHSWGKGVTRDYEKQNAAALAGWSVFRFTTDMLSGREIDKHLLPVIEFARERMASIREK